MNHEEKKALTRFILLYTLSSFILMAIIAILYYNKAAAEAKMTCEKDLKNTLLSVEMDLRDACMNGEPYRFDPSRYKLKVGLFDQNRSVVASNLVHPVRDFSKKINMQPTFVQMLKQLRQPLQNIAWIVTEDIRMPSQLHQLKLLIALTMLGAMLFVAFIGYLLSRLLLRPAKERIASLNRFIKDATHEINTPVTALLMSVSALKKKRCGEEKLLRHISISAKQISSIYNTLSYISFNEQQRERRKRFDLKKAIQKNIAFFEEIAQSKKIVIQSDLEPTYVTMVREDADRLIGNLLSNAIKYSYAGTKITVTLHDAIMHVSDEGIGIAPRDQQLILKRYKRVSDRGGGFGIGLDIVNTICIKYAVKLSIQSSAGEGARFTLDFSALRHPLNRR
jgi:two-component system OmpR family sensor kinase